MTASSDSGRGLDPAWYLGATLLGFLMVQSALYVAAAQGSMPGPLLELVLVLSGPLVGAALWWRTSSGAVALPRVLRIFLLLLLAVWLTTMVMTVFRGGEVNALSLSVLVLVAFVWTKPPTRASVVKAGDAYVWGVGLVCLSALLLEVLGVLPSWYVAVLEDPAGFSAGERIGYWVPLAEPLGLDGRWAGPFLHPNFAGMALAVVILWGTGRFAAAVVGDDRRRGAWWGVLVILSLGMLFLTASRTATFATLVGALVLLVSVIIWGHARSVAALLIPVLSPLLLGLMLLGSWANAGGLSDASATIEANANLSGRTDVWAQYWQMWKSAPLLGVGDSGIQSAIDAGLLPSWATHAHNLVLDAGARNGVFFLLLVLALLLAALLSALFAARQGSTWGLAIVVMLGAEGLTETPFKWSYLTPTLTGLVLAALLAAPRRQLDHPVIPGRDTASTTAE